MQTSITAYTAAASETLCDVRILQLTTEIQPVAELSHTSTGKYKHTAEAS